MAVERRIVLVTGAPRSGTTAVGRLLAKAPGAGYLHEPFNVYAGLTSVERQFEMVGAAGFTAERLEAIVHGMRTLDLAFRREAFPRDGRFHRLVKGVVGGRTLLSYRLLRLRPWLRTIVWKDPLAAFVAGEVARRCEVPVLVTLRSPWAVAASFKRVGWTTALAELVARLEAAGLAPDPAVADAVRARPDPPPVRCGILLWRLVYAHLAAQARRSPRIAFVDLGNLVERPEPAYRALVEHLGLAWGTRIERAVRRAYAARGGSAVPTSRRTHPRRREVGAVNDYWRQLLDEREIAEIEELRAGLWPRLRTACLVAGTGDALSPRPGLL